MKKSLPPPENWQDFESLCKKLFGEIWNCKHTIKKNGRLGQPQTGVDIYGKPKGEPDYWGIQCKGKDNYEEKKLTEKEIDSEIQKALKFEPKLKTFIITTTASKDVTIEKYVRLKDIENCRNGFFEIILYCWQDLVDIIQENKDTFNWYVNNIQFKEQFDVAINLVTGYANNVVKPKFSRKTIKYEYSDAWAAPILPSILKSQVPSINNSNSPLFRSTLVNSSWCEINVEIRNTGSIVLQDWKFILNFPSDISDIAEDFINYNSPLNNQMNQETTWANKKAREILYKPLNNMTLIQKDFITFKCSFKPTSEKKTIEIRWQLLAKDFDREGIFNINIEPELIERIERIRVTRKEDEKTDIEIRDLKEFQ